MKKLIKKLLIVTVAVAMVVTAMPLTGINFGGVLKAFGYSYCENFEKAEFVSGDYAYNVIKWHYPYDEDIYMDGQYKLKYYEGVKIVDYHGSETTLVIPEYIDSKPVIGVGFNTITEKCTHKENKNQIESIVLPVTLKFIDRYAFKSMSNLKTITMTNNVEYISYESFYGCVNLKNINLSKNIMRIGSKAFYGCTLLESVVLPERLITLEYDAFENCSSLSSVTFGNKLQMIGADAFRNCNLESVDLKESVYEIEAYAFENNINLKTITLPEGLMIIGCGFIANTAVEELQIPKSVTQANGFLNGSKIQNIVLPSGFAPITKNLFGQNIQLETLTIENTEIMDNAIPYLKTLIIKGICKTYSIPFYYDSATETYSVPETIVFTDGISTTKIHDFLLDTMNYHFKADLETGYSVYTKEYMGAEEDILLGNSFVSGDYTYDLTAGGDAVITDYSGTSTEAVTVPSVFEHEGKEYAVVAIGNGAFAGTDASEYILPDTVKRIGDSAFNGCENLIKTNIPDGVTVIEPHTYGNCKTLAEITIPDSVVFIGDYAFANAYASTKIIIPSSVKTIGCYAFYNNWKATTVTLNEGLEKIGPYAFSNKTTSNSPEGVPFAYSLTLPSSLKEIGAYAFYISGVSGELVIPGNITVLSQRAFSACHKITSVIISEGVKEIGKASFYNCNYSTSIQLPTSLEIIGDNALNGMAISSITIPSGVTLLGKSAFARTKLVSVTVPSNVKRISENCFSHCKELKTVIIENGVEYIESRAFFSAGPIESIVIPESMVEITYDAFEDVKTINNVFFNAICYEYDQYSYDDNINTNGNQDENYVVTINPYGRFADIFGYDTQVNKLTVGKSVKYLPTEFLWEATVGEVILPDNLVAIGEYAFNSCTVNKPLDIPESVDIICHAAFAGAIIPEITLPRNLKNVEKSAFYAVEIENINYNCINCKFETTSKTEIEGIYKSPFADNSSVKNIVIGDSVEKIPDFLFCSLPNLENVNLHSGITSIGKGAFAFSGVKSVTGLENLEEIEDYTFNNCQNLIEFDMSNIKVTDIGYYAFANSGLASFNGSDLLESIGDGCFEGCTNLKAVNLGNKIMLIGANAFANCTSLTEITIPDSVKNIGSKAFYGDTTLKNVEMSDNVIYVADECFNGCSALEAITWNPASKLIGRLAFANCAALSEFDFVNIEKLYDNSFLNSGVTVAQLGEGNNETASELKEIEVQSFMDCDNLATLGIGGNVTTIKTQAFANCENLETAVIADSVTEIAEDAFDGCDKLTIYCSENSYAHTYAQTQGIRVSTLVIAPIPNQTYTGFEIKPEITVSASGDTLDKNIDFSVSYANNINVGNADVNVKGLGDFRMFASKAKFTIVTKNISAVTVAPIADQPYTGSAVTPELTVTDGLKVLREGTDYTVTYANNVNEGSATATITGKGNYSGTATTNFQISKDAEEPGFFAKIFSSISSFFARVISFFASIFM